MGSTLPPAKRSIFWPLVLLAASGLIGFAVLGIVGYLAYRHYVSGPLEDADPPAVTVVVDREGATAEAMESEVTSALEDALAGVEGAEATASQSREGTSTVTVLFRPGWDVHRGAQDVANALGAVQERLPASAGTPTVSKSRPDEPPVVWLALTSATRSPVEVSAFAEKQVKPLLLSVPGVGGVRLVGLHSLSVELSLDPNRLTAYGLTVQDVIRALREQGKEAPANRGRVKPMELDVRGPAFVRELDQLVVATAGGHVVRLRDLAAVQEVAESNGRAAFNGKAAVAVGVTKAPGSRLVDVCENVNQALPRLRETLPEDVALVVAVDYSVAVRERVPYDLIVEVRDPPGASAERLDHLLWQAENAASAPRDVAGVLRVVPRDGPGALYIRLVPPAERSRSLAEIRQEMRSAFVQFPGARVRLRDLSLQRFRPTGRYPVTLVVSGPERDVVADLARRVAERLEASGAARDAEAGDITPVPRMRFMIDREKCAQAGVGVRDVEDCIAMVANEGPGCRAASVVVRVPAAFRQEAESLHRLTVRAGEGRLVPLGALVKVEFVSALPVLRRYNLQPAVEVTANPAAGVPVAQAVQSSLSVAEQVRQEMELPDVYRVEALK
jgi:multidrug efflux pump subunit AcrB